MITLRHVSPGHTAAERFLEARLTHREAILMAELERDIRDRRWSPAGRRSFYRRCWLAGDALSRTVHHIARHYHK